MDSLAVFAPRSSPGIMDDREAVKDQRQAGRSLGLFHSAFVPPSPPSFSSSDDDDDDAGSSSSFCSSTSTLLSDDEEERDDEADSSSSSPLSKMSDLMAQLPMKRGLSRHYDGKSQSYTSLASVTCLDDLRKPERGPARKKLKTCRSYGGGMADAGAAPGRCNTINLFLPPPVPLPASPVKPAASATVVNKIGSSPASLQRPPPLVMGAERSAGFLRSSSRRPPPVPPQHRPAGFPASHPQPLLFA